MTQKIIDQNGFKNRISLVQSTFEDLNLPDQFKMAYINASMHECRDIDKVTSNVYNALKSEGYFVISDFPYPESRDGLRTIPGQIMAGINFFESQIDDLLLSNQTYVDLLKKHGFQDVKAFNLTPTHSVIYGRKPSS